MPKRKTIDPQLVSGIARNMLCVLPLLRKRLLRMDAVQAKHSIPLSHVQVLALLGDGYPLSVSDISQRLSIAKPNITPLVDRLLMRGYVSRQRDDNDHRVINILITEAGSEMLADIHETIAEQIRLQTDHLSAADFKELAEALDSVTRILSTL